MVPPDYALLFALFLGFMLNGEILILSSLHLEL
jgi:hypothetical protein